MPQPIPGSSAKSRSRALAEQGLPARRGFTDWGEVNARPYKHHQTLKTTTKTSSCIAHTY